MGLVKDMIDLKKEEVRLNFKMGIVKLKIGLISTGIAILVIGILVLIGMFLTQR